MPSCLNSPLLFHTPLPVLGCLLTLPVLVRVIAGCGCAMSVAVSAGAGFWLLLHPLARVAGPHAPRAATLDWAALCAASRGAATAGESCLLAVLLCDCRLCLPAWGQQKPANPPACPVMCAGHARLGTEYAARLPGHVLPTLAVLGVWEWGGVRPHLCRPLCRDQPKLPAMLSWWSHLPHSCSAAGRSVLQAFGACLQRTRLRTFLWTQPLLLAPVFWVGRAHCTNQLAASLEAARHLQHIASAMQRCASWLPVGPMLASVGAPATATSRRLSGSEGACLGVHFWLVVVLAYGLPAIVIHRLEGQEDHAWQLARKQRRQQEGQQRRQQEGQQGHEPGAADGDAAVERDLLLQRRPNAIGSAAELMLAGYAAWLLVQLTLPLLG